MLILSQPAKIASEMTYQCEFCKKTFSRESTILTHMCEPKRRRLSQNERGAQLGFQAYLEFYKLLHKTTKAKTFDDFADSPYYKAFVKFGHHCVNIQVINPPRMIDWLLRQQKKIDQWCSDRIYTEYLIDYLLTESVADALTRSVEYSIEWAEKNTARPQDYLRYSNANAICYAITTGRISPWVIYGSESGQRFLANLDSGQVGMIWPYINSDAWTKKFVQYPEDQAYAQEILTRAGW